MLLLVKRDHYHPTCHEFCSFAIFRVVKLILLLFYLHSPILERAAKWRQNETCEIILSIQLFTIHAKKINF